ncbi:alpha/beta fold hydrolase [Tsukamurella soli]|uniref:Alpha/beta fold hydrolase n=1 Tax=Tsukamurella soli TaxID=644556 RepID=A0ABP8KET4_9ACTN
MADHDVRFAAAYRDVLARWGDVTVVTCDTARARTRITVVPGPDGADSPLVVLLPGGGATSTVWFPQVADLAMGATVIAPDLPGDAGCSLRRQGLRGWRDVAAWCAEVVAAAGRETGAAAGRETGAAAGRPVTVVGHSYGAQIAVRFALDRPDLVAGVTLLDPTGVFARVSAETALHAVPLLLAPTGRRWRRYLDWETGGAALDPAWLRLGAAAADGSRMRPVRLPRPSPADIDRLAGQAGGVRVVLAERSRYHDARRMAADLRRRHPWITVETLPASHHELPFVWRP